MTLLLVRRSSIGAARPRPLRVNSEVSFTRGNGSSGTGTSRNAHSGAQPSRTSKTSSRSGAMAAATRSVCARNSAMARSGSRSAGRAKVRASSVASTIRTNAARSVPSRDDRAMAARPGRESMRRRCMNNVLRMLASHCSGSRTVRTTFASG